MEAQLKIKHFMNNTFSIITSQTIKSITEENPEQIYEAVKIAYIKHSEKKANNPPSYFLRFPDKPKSRIIALPSSIIENPRVAGIKWISSNPDNLNIGLKRASAVIILNSYDTGYPIACLEGAIISALRTVYSAILVCNLLLSNKKIQSLGVVGAGNLAERFLECLHKQNWSIKEINIFDLEPQACPKLQNKIKQINPRIDVKIIKKLKDLITTSEVIFLSTTSLEPYIKETAWFKHNPIVLNISLRDIAPEILVSSNNIVDDINHILNANTSPHLAQQKYNHSKFINCTVGQLIKGYNNFDSTKPIIFSPMGMGVLDLAVANYIYDKAKHEDLCINISNFFESYV